MEKCKKVSVKADYTEDTNEYELTQKDFELFKKEAEYWINVLGLKDWRIEFRMEIWETMGNCFGCASFYTYDRAASINLSPIWYGTKPNDDQIRTTAFHEVCEVWFADIRTLNDRNIFTIETQENGLIHKYIRTLENVLFEKNKEVKSVSKRKR